MLIKVYFQTWPGAKVEDIILMNQPFTWKAQPGWKRYMAEIEVPDNLGDVDGIVKVEAQEVEG